MTRLRRLRWLLCVLAIVWIASTSITAPVDGATPRVAADVLSSHARTPSWKMTETGAGSFNVVSCANARDCTAIGTSTGSDEVVTFNGTRWGPTRQLEQYAGEVVSLSCPVAGWCVALTDLAAVTTFRHGHWSRLTTIDSNPGPPYPGMTNAISCTSSDFCIAVDGHGNSETYNGTTWTKPRQIDQDDPLNDVSCATGNSCVAVDGGGRMLKIKDGRWSGSKVIDNTALTGVSCASAKFCVAVDLLGRVLISDGSTWSHPVDVDQIAATPLAVSCPEAGRCVAVDGEGRVLVLQSGRWTSPQAIEVNSGVSVSLIDVACRVGVLSFCVAVDSSGDTFTITDLFAPVG